MFKSKLIPSVLSICMVVSSATTATPITFDDFTDLQVTSQTGTGTSTTQVNQAFSFNFDTRDLTVESLVNLFGNSSTAQIESGSATFSNGVFAPSTHTISYSGAASSDFSLVDDLLINIDSTASGFLTLTLEDINGSTNSNVSALTSGSNILELDIQALLASMNTDISTLALAFSSNDVNAHSATLNSFQYTNLSDEEPTPVPEPGTLALMGGGLTAMGLAATPTGQKVLKAIGSALNTKSVKVTFAAFVGVFSYIQFKSSEENTNADID